MKKLCLILAVCFALFSMSTTAFGASVIKEEKGIRFIVDGKTVNMKKAAIKQNGRYLLSAYDILPALGVINDNNHIQWDAQKKSITVYKDDLKLNFKDKSKIMRVNDVEEQMDTTAVYYKASLYIPVSYVAQKLGNKVLWDGSSKSIIIRDLEEFNQIKAIMEKSDSVMNSYKKLKFGIDGDIKMQQNGMNITMGMNMDAEVDKEAEKMHMYMEINAGFISLTMESYYSDNMEYSSSFMTDGWTGRELSDEEYHELFASSDVSDSIESDDIICAQLFLGESENPDQLLLIGNIAFDEMLNDAAQAAQEDSSYTYESSYAEIYIDKKSYVCDKVYMKTSGNTSASGSKQKMNMDLTISFSGLGEDFEIVVPDEVIEAAGATEDLSDL